MATVFPDRFNSDALESAKLILRHTYPAAYERFYNVILKPGESHKRDDEVFKQANANNYLVLSASSTGDGFVKVFAGRGGRNAFGHYPADTKTFLVPKAEYSPKMVLNVGVATYPEIEAIR